MNAAEYVLMSGADGKIAVECWDERITYAELRDAVARSATVWRARGLEPGERVLVVAPDSIDWVIAYLSIIWAGGVAVGLNERLFDRELTMVLHETDATFVYCDQGSVSRLEELLERAAPRSTLVTGAQLAALAAQTATSLPLERDDEDPALWIYTSGTTGTPKAVVHAQRMVRGTTEFATEVLEIGGDAKVYASSKLFFAYSLGSGLCGGLGLGGTVVVDPQWPTAERVAAVVEHHSPTVLYSVPTLYLKMLQAGAAPKLEGVQHFVSAGEALAPRIAGAWRSATGTAPWNAYGASETVVLMLYSPDESGLLTTSPHVDVRLPEPTPPPRDPHRLWLRHTSVAAGYWNRPEADSDAFSDGWFSPGDLFRRHAGGLWEFCGRGDDLVKISGQWVSTIDVELALAGACGESVTELAAVAFTNADGLTSIALFAVATEGDKRAAHARLRHGIEALPKLRQPREVHWLTELPRTDTGKLRRNVLRERYLDKKAPALAVAPGQERST
jgi:acyl-coenzyme A synthetase/AMP-(fatty) acid ligase